MHFHTFCVWPAWTKNSYLKLYPFYIQSKNQKYHLWLMWRWYRHHCPHHWWWWHRIKHGGPRRGWYRQHWWGWRNPSHHRRPAHHSWLFLIFRFKGELQEKLFCVPIPMSPEFVVGFLYLSAWYLPDKTSERVREL